MSRAKLSLASLVCIVLGGVVIATKIHDYGLSRAVVLGISSGALVTAVLAFFVWRNWNSRLTETDQRKVRKSMRLLSVLVLLTAGIGAAISVVLRAVGGDVQTYALSFLSALMIGGGILCIPIVLARKDILETEGP